MITGQGRVLILLFAAVPIAALWIYQGLQAVRGYGGVLAVY
jgi:hypothetical protein